MANIESQRNTLLQNFDEQYQKLNSQQKFAVDQIDGPVLVIAGPGTGKTQILSVRIANILQKTDYKPENILCLTYTDAGVVSMKKRLKDIIGHDSFQVRVNTFHTFCNNVIQDNLEYFGNTQKLTPITELEQIEVLRTIIDEMSFDNPLKKLTGEDVYYEINNLISFFQTLKKENFDPEELISEADYFMAQMPEMEKYIYKKKSGNNLAGDLKIKDVEKDTKKIEKFKASCQAFITYKLKVRKAGFYDFDDMIKWVIDAFSEHEDLLLNYQEQFQYILVDEFQDTNGAQNSILNLLCNYDSSPNIFVVGDDDQSIYSFQGAENGRIKEYINRYIANGLFTVVLIENYRSTQQVLDVSKSLIEFNVKSRLIHDENLKRYFKDQNQEFHKDLIAFFDKKGKVEVTKYFNVFHQAADIAIKLENILNTGGSLNRSAVLYHSHSDVEELCKVLEYRNIPYTARKRVDILDEIFIQKIISIIKYISLSDPVDPAHNSELFKILHFDFFDINSRDLDLLPIVAQKVKVDLRQLVLDSNTMFKSGIVEVAKIKAAMEQIQKLRKDLFNHPFQEFFGILINEVGVLSKAINSDEKFWNIECLTTLFNFIKNENVKNSIFSIYDFIKIIDQMKFQNVQMNIEKIFYSDNGINLITSHSSKGLQFENVFLINCSDTRWEKKRNRGEAISFMSMNIDKDIEKDKESKIEELRRLFYVAATRTEKNLLISYPEFKLDTKSTEESNFTASQFVTELIGGSDIEIKNITLSNEIISQYIEDSLLKPINPTINKLEKHIVDERLKNYKMSVTHLNKYLRCKLSFYFENVLKVPQGRNESAAFGNAMHKAVELLFEEMKKNPQKEFPSFDEYYGYFAFSLETYKSHFTPESFERKLAHGKNVCQDFYNDFTPDFHKNVLIELKLGDTLLDNEVPITGNIDKLELFDNQAVNVIDYKTGKINPAKNNPPIENLDPLETDYEKINGGDYWRQIIFYKILLDNSKKYNFRMRSGALMFFEKGDKKSNYIVIDDLKPEYIDMVKTQIKKSYQGIMNHDFYTGCGDEKCNWCSFVKNNYKGELLEIEE